MDGQLSPGALRQRVRSGEHRGNTSGFAAGYVQCNIVILPADWANDFLRFCQLNPKPCPLVATSNAPGDPAIPPLGVFLLFRGGAAGGRTGGAQRQ
jgi:uncharacterized protein YcsI (UPF0317 family)